ncbi:peptidase S10 [Nodosilinea sp. P-1105]|uniref:S10 family peptidase n=1 Tax=Nodosilinea sp. P-1105 TaxID=2546229 RepID=UPI00146ABC16|nr:peptidase S10 [Nodosilinea sp. P-1105]NMF85132.1 peptidase S10 [Nodosilinea sp. P-1105]
MPDTPQPSFPRPGQTTEHSLSTPQGDLAYTATAGWQPLYENDKPIAQLFHVAYTVSGQEPATRPITFVFNGGPGAASAYLHMGALGPKRVAFNPDGSLPRPPVTVVDNGETWLGFTDLVFIDPLGTGFSRTQPNQDKSDQDKSDKGEKTRNQTDKSAENGEKPDPEQAKKFWEVERDLNALGEFIQGYLSRNHRWLSPVFIAGESYGGFRVAKLARKLQQDYGVGLCGAILISPVMEFELLWGSDYTLSGWATALPSMAAAAAHHGRLAEDTSPEAQAAQAETFVRETYLPFLAMGTLMAEPDRQRVYGQLADLVGLPLEVVQRHRGRIDISIFARELLRDQERILGLYDASVVAIDPFPDRLLSEGTDPTLEGLDRLFTGAINSHLRTTLGVETPLTYNLLSMDVFRAWRFLADTSPFKQGFVGSADDLRIGMTLNPHMQVYISHGIFDLVTPYFSSNFLANLMHLNPAIAANLTLRHFRGGHMFYTWESSRQQWQAEMKEFYQQAVA